MEIIKQIAASIAAITAIATAVWALGDDSGYRPIIKREFVGFVSNEFKMAQDTTQQLVKSVQWLELQNLENLYATGVLSDQEKQKRCFLAYQLQAFFITDCNWAAFQAQQ